MYLKVYYKTCKIYICEIYKIYKTCKTYETYKTYKTCEMCKTYKMCETCEIYISFARDTVKCRGSVQVAAKCANR